MFAQHVAGVDLSAHTQVEVEEAPVGELILRAWFRPFSSDPSLTTGTLWNRGIAGDYPVEVRRADPANPGARWMTVESPDESRTLRATVVREEEVGMIAVAVWRTGPALDTRGVIQ